MKAITGILACSALFAACSSEQSKTQKTIDPVENITLMSYPETKKTETTDIFFGTKVIDPYRWLEDDRAEDTKAWVIEENKVTEDYLSQIPYRDAIKRRLEKLWNYEKFSAPFKEGEYTYFYKNDGLQNQYVLYRQKGKEDAEVFLDPNKFSTDGTTSLAGISFSKDGSLAAYQISEGGSDWRKVIVLNTSENKIVGDTLLDLKFTGLAWKGNEGFYYSSYDKPKEGSALSGLTQYHKLYFHKLGTPQSDDQLIFGGDKTKRRYIGADLTEDERFLVISAANTTSGNELYIQDLAKAGSPIVNVINKFDKEYNVIDNQGDKLLIITNLDAPNNRVVSADINKLDPKNWKDIIPETENVLNIGTGGGKLFANYLKDATSLVQQYDYDGKLERTIELPAVGTASGFSAKLNDNNLYYSFTSYVYPPSIFEYDIASGESKEYKKAGVDFDPSLYTSEQIFYTSKDGTKVPMIITYKKGIELNGTNPTILYGYGGFNISLSPSFSTSNIILLEQGGI